MKYPQDPRLTDEFSEYLDYIYCDYGATALRPKSVLAMQYEESKRVGNASRTMGCDDISKNIARAKGSLLNYLDFPFAFAAYAYGLPEEPCSLTKELFANGNRPDPSYVNPKLQTVFQHNDLQNTSDLYGVKAVSWKALEAWDYREHVADHGKGFAGLQFTSGTTDSLNLVAQTLRPVLKAICDAAPQLTFYIALSQTNHHANILPWVQLTNEISNLEIKFLDFAKVLATPLFDGNQHAQASPELGDSIRVSSTALDYDAAAELRNVLVVSLSSVDNVTGQIQPLGHLLAQAEALSKRNEGSRPFFVMDHAQSAYFHPSYVPQIFACGVQKLNSGLPEDDDVALVQFPLVKTTKLVRWINDKGEIIEEPEMLRAEHCYTEAHEIPCADGCDETNKYPVHLAPDFIVGSLHKIYGPEGVGFVAWSYRVQKLFNTELTQPFTNDEEASADDLLASFTASLGDDLGFDLELGDSLDLPTEPTLTQSTGSTSTKAQSLEGLPLESFSLQAELNLGKSLLSGFSGFSDEFDDKDVGLSGVTPEDLDVEPLGYVCNDLYCEPVWAVPNPNHLPFYHLFGSQEKYPTIQPIRVGGGIVATVKATSKKAADGTDLSQVLYQLETDNPFNMSGTVNAAAQSTVNWTVDFLWVLNGFGEYNAFNPVCTPKPLIVGRGEPQGFLKGNKAEIKKYQPGVASFSDKPYSALGFLSHQLCDLRQQINQRQHAPVKEGVDANAVACLNILRADGKYPDYINTIPFANPYLLNNKYIHKSVKQALLELNTDANTPLVTDLSSLPNNLVKQALTSGSYQGQALGHLVLLPSQSPHLVLTTNDGSENELGQFLYQRGIVTRVGKHCAHLIHSLWGCEASVRFTFGLQKHEPDTIVARVVSALTAWLEQAQATPATPATPKQSTTSWLDDDADDADSHAGLGLGGGFTL